MTRTTPTQSMQKKARRRASVLAAAVAAGTLGFSQAANAAYLFDTGPPTCCAATGISADVSYAGRFTLNDYAVIDGVEGQLVAVPPQFYTIAIRANDEGLPGEELYSAVGLIPPGSSSVPWHGVSGVSWALDPGSYWVSFELRAGQFNGPSLNLRLGAANPMEATARTLTAGGPWSPVTGFASTAAIRISGQVVDPTPPPGVPEPTTWALMLVGLGTIGATLRRRRTAAFAAGGGL